MMDAVEARALGPTELGKKDKLPIPWERFHEDLTENAGDLTGREIVRMLSSPEVIGLEHGETANFLHEAGIPGIRYLDQGARSAGEGSRNYVVFDPSLINIMRKYKRGGAP